MKELIVFLGPSLALREARNVVQADFWPPARQGDVFRALVKRPTAIVLIDGVFEVAPSVWHHELRAALAAGVAVFGASSMGALRAVELQNEGLIGVGAIFERYASGLSIDDGDVALLHADQANNFRPLTVPLVNVLATIERARREKVVSQREAARVLRLARQTFFQDRHWAKLVTQSPKLAQWLASGNEVDQKAVDARQCLAIAADFVAKVAHRAPPRPFVASSFVRRRRWLDVHAQRLKRVGRRADAKTLEADGTRRLLLAALAKAGGLSVTVAERERARRSVPARGLAADEREFIAEIVALEAKVLRRPERFVADGPSLLEGLALEAVLRGHWGA